MMEVLSRLLVHPDVFLDQHLGPGVSGFATVFQMLVGHRQQSGAGALA
jgi:hypothetical protein